MLKPAKLEEPSSLLVADSRLQREMQADSGHTGGRTLDRSQQPTAPAAEHPRLNDHHTGWPLSACFDLPAAKSCQTPRGIYWPNRERAIAGNGNAAKVEDYCWSTWYVETI